MKNFWAQLERPVFALAPMADVTDAAFRQLIAKYSKVPGGVPYVTWSEFVSADGLSLAPEAGRAKLMRDLVFSPAERQIVAQFFTSTPRHMEAAAKLAAELGFDGVDINMGCPDRSIEKQGAGAKLITTPEVAQELIYAAKAGAKDLPVSVKTRLGYNKDVLDEWLPKLLAATPAVVTVHARTRKEMSAVPARWERVARAVAIRNEVGSNTLIFGNGDLKDVADARAKIGETGADGAMLGRAIFGNPWLFATENHPLRRDEHDPNSFEDNFPSLEERLRVAVEHTYLFEELLGDIKNFAIMKKHFKAYVEGFAGAKELRVELMNTNSATDVDATISAWLKNNL